VAGNAVRWLAAVRARTVALAASGGCGLAVFPSV